MAEYGPVFWSHLGTSTLRSLVSGTPEAGLAVPTGETLRAMRSEIEGREQQERRVRDGYVLSVTARPLAELLYEVHGEPTAV